MPKDRKKTPFLTRLVQVLDFLKAKSSTSLITFKQAVKKLEKDYYYYPNLSLCIKHGANGGANLVIRYK